jgi:D-beta-D-heptose 7-phosphate kinase/D-beta-D-heptose 1-phosphate adenosyltransferase
VRPALELRDVLGLLGAPRVAIIGDLILDRYVTGEVTRISPEAPIPVLTAKSVELRLGGAGNVAANLRAMDAEVDVLGAVGDDGHGRAMREMLSAAGIGARDVVVDPTRPTIEKTRMMSGVQQMLRVDHEDARPMDGVALERVLAALPGVVARADAVVLSDYGKGFLTDRVLRVAIDAARAKGIPVLVDPKGADFSRYRGATLITPNRKEAETALGRRITGFEDLPAAADELISRASLDLIVITLGADGIYFRTHDAGATPTELQEGRIPTAARAVFDVVGAGDTVVAHLALYLAQRLPLPIAVGLANHAAGVVVGRLGTASVTRAELCARLEEHQPHTGKVHTRVSLGTALEGWRRDGKRIVFTNGCFDVLHAGHVQYLRFARSRGDVLIVGLNDDDSVRRLKGPTRPVNSLEDRSTVLSALEVVDAVVPFGEDTPKALVEHVTPHVLVKGEDYSDKPVVGREWVESHGGQVVLAPFLQGRSTTGILARASGDGATPGCDAARP